MRICLINPPRTVYRGLSPVIFQPLGLAYVAAVLEKNHEVSIIDALAEGLSVPPKISDWRDYRGLEYDEIALKVKGVSPDLVGITVPDTLVADSAFETVQAIKGVNRNTTIILGGPHPSVRPVDCLREGVDFVVIGEGENTIVELVQVLEQETKDEFRNIKGIAYLRDGEPVITEPRPLIQDLDSLPLPARHLLPMDAYCLSTKKPGLHDRLATGVAKRWASVITSRGCPYNCVFCSIHVVMGRRFRARSPENVVSELEQLVNQHAVSQIDFEDDNMTLNKARIHHICDLIIEKGLHIEWRTPNGIRADTLDEDILIKMKRAGCKELWVSPESGVQQVVDQVIKKKLDLRRVEEAVALCKKVGIKVNCFFVMGLIGETKEDMRKSIEYANKLRRLGANHCTFSIAMPFYGTELYEQAREEGYFLPSFDDQKLTKMEPVIETPEFTAQEVYNLWLEAHAVIPPSISLSIAIRAFKEPRKKLRALFQIAKYALKRRLVNFNIRRRS